jgi:DNA/RNA endonuclease G (NUC1)
MGSLVLIRLARRVSADTSTAVSISSFGTAVTQDFNSLVSSGTGTLAANTPAGWGFSESGTNANTSYTAGTGSGTAGDTYSFGSAAVPSDRALGQLRSGTLISILGGTFQNNASGTITSLNIAYTGEQWRLGATGRTVGERMDFQYSTNATSLTTGTWIDVNALDFTPPVTAGTVGALDGNANHVLLSSNITGLNITAGSTFWIRWTDVDASSSDDGLAIDDFSITASGVPPSPTPTPIPTPPNNVVISQVYGGGGNTGATLKNDYIELINHSNSPVNLNGWSVQAFVSTTGTWQVTPLTNFTLQPGQYYLIQESQGAGGTDNLPTPDATGTIPVSSTSTKVALINNLTTITAACPDPAAAGVVDLVGYGATDCFEGAAPAATLDNTSAALRRNEGCFDTNENANDFVTGSPNPRNSSFPTHDCTSLSAYGTANPSSVLQGGSTTLTVYVAGAQNPNSTGITVTADLSQIGGSPTQSFAGSGNVFTFNATVPANNSTGMKSLPVTVTDAQSRNTNTNILVSVLPLVADHITISQVYGGGGNTGATFTNDYVELYNPTASTVTVTGWSLQYASAAGTSWTNKQPIGGTIGPGEYYLVGLASGGANGAPLPVSPNISGDINMSATAGKIALVNNSSSLSGGCPLGNSHIVDFVGYGTTATCHEGSANTPAPSNSTAIFRKNGGSLDGDQNGTDFQTGTPSPRRTAPIVELGPWVSGTDPGTDDNTIPYDASITVNFSEPVTLDSGWYNITCSVTGSHNSPNTTEAHTNDLKTYAVTPNSSFQFGEHCSVTIFKTAVHDVDTDDSGADTDTLFDNYSWSFTVVDAGQAAPYPPSVHLTMGNPSGADAFQPLNYLMEKPTYSLSYNNSKGTPNWVSWHLDSSWYGTLARVDTFRPDPQVDPSWYRVQAFDYAGSGFDRGHMTPNADRDNQNRVPINQETYLMSNMVPQSPANNQGPWAQFEGYLRTQSDAGNEIYIVSGPSGIGGIGSASGNTINTIANGHVTVPSATWKVALIMPQLSGDDVARVSCASRTLAILIPNNQTVANPWQNYLTTVDAVEQLTGYNFFSNLPPAVQACVEAGSDGNNPPGTADQTASTAEETPVTIHLQGLQSTAATLTFSIVSGPSSGQLASVGTATCSNGVCTADVDYTPGSNFFGSDSFTFRASNGTSFSNTSTVSITITNVEDAPDAVDDSPTVAEDSGANVINVLSNDTDVDNDTLTVSAVTQGSHGSVTNNGTSVSYTPNPNFFGNDSFTYTISDGNGGTDTATVNVTVTNVEDAPDAVDDSPTVAEDSGANVINVLNNDTDVDNDTLTVSAVTQGSHGTVTNNGSSVSYTPNGNFFGTDTFTYTISDGNGGTDTATVNVTVTNVEDAPDAVNDAPTVAEDSSANVINVLSNDTDVDNDTLTVSAVTQGSHGSVTNNGTSVSYTPSSNFFGTDTFTYTISDGNGGTDTATVNVTITNVNDAPVATNDNYVTNSNTTLNVTAPGVLSNDSDIDGPSLSSVYVAASGPSHGVLSLNGDGSFSYSPNPNYTGSDSFSYQAFDGSAYSNVATVMITVNDTVPPTLNSTLAITMLTSTNSDLINVGLNASATDNSGTPVQIQVAVFGDENDETPTKQNVLHSPDAKDIGPNNTLRLRAERVEANDGRVYLIVVTATDTSGNVSRSYHTVVVPKSSKQSNIDSVNAQAAAAVSYAQTHNGAAPSGYFVIGDGPIIGPKQ